MRRAVPLKSALPVVSARAGISQAPAPLSSRVSELRRSQPSPRRAWIRKPSSCTTSPRRTRLSWRATDAPAGTRCMVALETAISGGSGGGGSRQRQP